MSKAFKGKTCVYCTVEGASSTPDHVIARKFFPLDQRHGIPKVPACTTCNNTKSHLEHYLTAVLPFGGRHARSSEVLETLVPGRLQKNPKLTREIADSFKARAVLSDEGFVQPGQTFHVDADKIEQLYQLIVRGLCAFHWGLLLPRTDADLHVGFLRPEGVEIVEKLLRANAKRRCHGSVGGGLFQYEGAQALDNDLITVWKMSLYGVEYSAEGSDGQRAAICYASSAPLGRALPISSD